MPIRQLLANAIRFLSIDSVEKARSGHPGMPMGMAEIAEVLWNDFMKHSPQNPKWMNRDRFVLSNGHGSMLLYSLLHLTGYADMTIEQLKNFRQLHSKTAGHPEYGLASGIETTTGPLGQGIANAVGMALAEKILSAQFNRPGFPIIDHYTYVFLGDGCMMEGISHECCSLAGHLKLGKLIAFWDDNGISIDGETTHWYSDNTVQRFEAYGWHVIPSVDGHQPEAIAQAIIEAQNVFDKPTLICCKTIIGFGSPNRSGTADVHGAPLGAEEVKLTRQQLAWPYAPFEIPAEIYSAFNAEIKGAEQEKIWNELFFRYQQEYPEVASELLRRIKGEIPQSVWHSVEAFIAQTQELNPSIASRKASFNFLNALASKLPELIGGSADLTGSNLTLWDGASSVTAENAVGQYIYYGVREFAMFAIMNGLSLYGGFIPYGGTFLTFVDYGRNAVRLAALMRKQAIYVLTHDSIGLGEDGPTHQPIEHAAMLRLTPNLSVWRPGDAIETAVAWHYALKNQTGPTALLLSRQNLPAQKRSSQTVSAIYRGGYILRDCEGLPELIIIATGSELDLAVQAQTYFSQQNRQVRVVSMPSTDVFESQDASYQEYVLPSVVRKRLAIEAGTSDYWYRYVGLDGKVLGLKTFGESAPAEAVFEYFGFTLEHVIQLINEML